MKYSRLAVFKLFVCILAACMAAPVVLAGALSDDLETKLINHTFRGAPYTAPATLYVGLATSACGDASFGTEVTGGSYARVAVGSSVSNWTAVAGGNATTTNVNGITFPAPSASWGVITHWFIADAPNAGNLLVCAPLTTAKTVNSGDAAPAFPPAALSVQIDN